MARALDAGKVDRTEIYLISPEFLICNPEDNSRAVPHSEDELKALAHSILEHGQLQPVVGRVVEGKKVQVIAGYGRTEAIKYINSHLNPPKPLKVRVQVSDMNAEEAFVRSIAENIERAETTPIDDAHAQRKLREVFGWTDTKIAELYKKSVAYIGQLRKTLQLSSAIKAEVSNGNLPLSTAITLTELPEPEREKVVAEAKGKDGKVSTGAVKKKVREAKEKTGKKESRTLKEVKEYLTANTGIAEDEPIRELCNALLDFIEGGKEEDLGEAFALWTKKPEEREI